MKMICNKMNTFTKTVDIDYAINKLRWRGGEEIHRLVNENNYTGNTLRPNYKE